MITEKRCLDCGVVKSPKGNYCKSCGYKHRKRPCGLKYNLMKENPTRFKKGQVPWNKGAILKEKVTYKELHRWVARHKGRPTQCESCESNFMVQWANKSHEYRRDLDDWIALCKPCHGAYDKGNRGAAVRIFGAKDVACQ